MYYQKWQQNKYKAKRTEYNGILYHSKLEVAQAMELDLRLKAKDIKGWTRQVKIEHNLVKDNGRYYLTDTPTSELKKQGKEFIHLHNYYMDFVVEHNDGEMEYIECKGLILEPFKFKWKLTEALFENDPIRTLTLIK